MSEKNIHWAASAELIRRGGRKNRPTRIDPENVDGVVDQLRESNHRVRGGQPLVGVKPWRQKTTGAADRTLEIPQTDLGNTKRVLDWASVIHPLSKKGDEAETTGGRSDEETASRAIRQEERSMGYPPSLSFHPRRNR